MAAKRDAKGRYVKGTQPETGFKPGQSGNPKGRLPRVVEDTYLQALFGVATVEKWEKACLAILDEAIGGNVKAWAELAKYMMPPPAQKLELTGEDGGPVRTEEITDATRVARILELLDRARARRDGQLAEPSA